MDSWGRSGHFSVCVCVCVCCCTCVQASVYVLVCACLCVCAGTCACVCICAHMCMCVCMYCYGQMASTRPRAGYSCATRHPVCSHAAAAPCQSVTHAFLVVTGAQSEQRTAMTSPTP